MVIELEKASLSVEVGKHIKIKYENKETEFRKLDCVIDNKVIIEAKALDCLIQ